MTALALNRLRRREIEVLVESVVGNAALPESTRSDIVERADGVPLFAEEIAKAAVEFHESPGSRVAAATPSPARPVPASAREMSRRSADSDALLPPPPALGSAGLALDQEVGRAALAMRDSLRWKLAAMDADLTFPNAAGTFSCALGAPVTEQDTPRLYQMLRRVLTDAGLATYAAKDKYQHARPFMLDDQPICTPDKDKSLRMQGSYLGYYPVRSYVGRLGLGPRPRRGFARAERRDLRARPRLRPEPPCLQRALESDVIEGRTIGAATVARLHANPTFLADLAAAKDELAAVRAKQLPPQRDCAFEAAALAQTLPQAP